MKPFTNKLKKKIQRYIKNKIDIADLIKDVDIRNQDLSGAIITHLNCTEKDISNCNFARTIIGKEGSIVNFSGACMHNCNFKDTRFIGKVYMNSVDARGCNFAGAFTPNWIYRNANFEGANFCDAVIRIGTREGKGAIFDTQFFRDLAKNWNIEIRKK